MGPNENRSLGKGKERRSIRHNFSWYAAAVVVYALCQWGVLILLAKFGNAELVGLLGLGIAVSAPIFAFSNLSGRDLLVTDVTGEKDFQVYFQLRFVSSLLSYLLIIAIGLLYGNEQYELTAIAFLGGVKFLDAIIDLFEGAAQRHERLSVVAVLRGAAGLAAVLGVFCAVSLSQSIPIIFFSLFLARLLAFLLFLSVVSKEFGVSVLGIIRSEWRWSEIRALALHAFPLGVRRVVVAFNYNLPRYLVEYFLGLAALGFYTGISAFLQLGVLFCESLGHAAAPQLAKAYFSSRSQFLKLLFLLILFGAVSGLAGVAASYFFGEFILKTFYGPAFGEYVWTFVVVMAASGCMYVYGFMNLALTIMRKLRVSGALAVIALFANGAVCLTAIPSLGVVGAGWATLAGAIVLLLGSVILVRGGMDKIPSST